MKSYRTQWTVTIASLQCFDNTRGIRNLTRVLGPATAKIFFPVLKLLADPTFNDQLEVYRPTVWWLFSSVVTLLH